MVSVGIMGARGYAGQELVKILAGHPGLQMTVLQATADQSEPYANLFPYFKGKVDLPCTKVDAQALISAADIVFLALPHKISMEYVPLFLAAGKKVIDLSADYRLPPDLYATWYGVPHKDQANLPAAVYGMPELYADKIRGAKLIANPGCYPTSVILGIAPMLKKGAVRTDLLIADAKSGASGAGRKADIALNFCEVHDNLKAYKINEHQHKPEINRILSQAAGVPLDVVFTPHLIPMDRGILSTIYMRLTGALDTEAVIALYREFYAGKPFVRISEAGKFPEIRDVVGTNYCDIGVKVTGQTLIAVSCIDNLVKGAAGQAVQNLNLMCGFDEREGLR